MTNNENQAPLKRDEYTGLRYLWATSALLNGAKVALQGRCKNLDPTSKAWKDLSNAYTAVGRAFKTLIETVPNDKRQMLVTELRHTYADVRTNYAGIQNLTPNYVCMLEETALGIAKMAQGNSCDFCTKCGKDAERCKLKKLIDDSLMYKTPAMPDGGCIYRRYQADDDVLAVFKAEKK